MFRYMCLIWNPANQRQSEAALLLGRRLQTRPQWQEVLHLGGLRILCANANPQQVYYLSHRSGVVLGELFERNRDPEDAMPSRHAVLGLRQTAGIVASHGKRLISDYWGNYVAFLHDSADRKVWVLKDPAGDMPCYSTVFRDVTLFFSCIATCMDLRLLHFSIRRAYLEDRMVLGCRCPPQDALNEVSQVHRGECVEIDPRCHPGQAARHQYWNPLSFADPEVAIEDPDRAARALRGTVRSCTHTLAGCHESLLHRLSGGLDSSIVSGCLKDAPHKPRITSYIYFNPRAFSDERPWAQLAALHAGCEHVECALLAREIRLALMRNMRPAAAPTSVLAFLLRSIIDAPLAAAREATAIFSGDGGDGGFCDNASAHAVAEYLQRHGLRPEAFRIAAQVALGTQRSTFKVFSRSLRSWLLGSTPKCEVRSPPVGHKLVNPDIVATLGEHLPSGPWFRPTRTALHSFRRMDFLPPQTEYYNVMREPDSQPPRIVSPLYAQPAIELFLRIPLYVHFEGGRDRGLARRAFRQEVPQPILRRMRKELAPGIHGELVRRHRDLLKEVFLDGVLMSEGLLDRSAVHAALSDDAYTDNAVAAEIFQHLDAEIWARHWTMKNRRSSAAVPSEPLAFVARAP